VRRWLLAGAVIGALLLAWWSRRSGPGRTSTTELKASPADGQGRVVLEQAGPVEVGSRGSWTFRYRPAATGIAIGGGIVLQISPFWGWSEPQTADPAEPGFVRAECSDPRVRLEADFGAPHWVSFRVRGAALKPPAEVRLTYGATVAGAGSGGAYADSYAEHGQEFLVKVDGDGDGFFAEVRPAPRLDILPEAPAAVVVVAPSLAVAGERWTLRLALVDRRDNYCFTATARVRLRSEPAGLELPDQLELAGGHAAVEARAPRPGRFGVRAEVGGLEPARSNPIEVRRRHGPYRLVWGDLHGHSNLSDGTGSIDDYYTYARDVAGLEVAVLSDHDHHGLHAIDERPELWRALQQGAARYYQPGRFVTLLGYEWTNWTYGHKHVLFLDRSGPLLSMNSPATDTPEELWRGLEGHRALTISHHPGGGPVATDWRFWDPRFEPVVEIVSIHGNSEHLGAPGGIYSPAPGHFVQDALAKGYRLGLVGSGDSHNGHPGRHDLRALTAGLAGIYVRELTREAVWEALFARRVFATSGERMVVEFGINGLTMGSELTLRSPSEPRRIAFRVLATAPLVSVTLVKNNQDWLMFGTDSEQPERLEGTALDDSPATDGTYYYVRAIQQGDRLAWSSPIWVKIR
jgi:hypothetical protein